MGRHWISLAVPLLAAAGALSGCTSYGGIAKDTQGRVYLTGSTSFLFFGTSWVRRCREAGGALQCEELKVEKGAAAPASAETAGSLAGGTDAVAEAGTPGPVKALTPDDARRLVLAEGGGQIAACRERYARDAAAIRVRFAVASHGEPYAFQVARAADQVDLGTCVVTAIKAVRFPSWKGDPVAVDLELPFGVAAEVVAERLRSAAGQLIERCRQTYAKGTAALKLRVTARASGELAEVALVEPAGNAPLESCVARSAKTATVPPFLGAPVSHEVSLAGP